MNNYEQNMRQSEINKILTKMAEILDISTTQYEDAVAKYQAMANYLGQDPNIGIYSPELYPQGSFGLGTMVKPITDKDEFDIVVIVRGGGAEVGMTCYNHFDLCKSIAGFPIPVLTGIGHSTNLTVAEMVSYRNAITPTQLAEFLVMTFREFDLEIRQLAKQMMLQSERTISSKNQLLNSLVNERQLSTQKRIQLAKGSA